MLNNPVIIGLGHAGLRWQKILNTLGYRPLIIDTDPEKGGLDSLDTATWVEHNISFAIVCTPPDQHIANIKECLDYSIPVLCEKPLCAFGQVEQAKELLKRVNADSVRVAYNYRYSPDINYQEVRDNYENIVEQKETKITLFASQQRQLPSWGIILDHLSHDVDLFRALFGEMTIETARLIEKPTKTSCITFGTFDSGIPFKIHDETKKNKCERVANICVDGYQFSMTPNPAMFTNMLMKFMKYIDGKEEYMAGGLEDAIKTQEVLEYILLYTTAIK